MRLNGCLTALAVILMTISYVKAETYVVSVTCADDLELYTDASTDVVTTHDNKATSKDVSIAANTKVISIKATAKVSTVEAGILASVKMEYPGDYITDATWKCSSTSTSGWTTANFDDSGWAYATVAGNNDNSRPSGLSKVTTIDKYANWIWTTNYKTQNRHSTVYCRGHIEISRSYDNYGRLFAIGFMENILFSGTSTIRDIKLLFSTLQPTDVTVRISAPLMASNDDLYFESVVLTVKAGDVVVHNLKRSGTKSYRHMVSSTFETKAIRVIATANVKIVGENQDQHSTDLFLTIPINSLGTSNETNEYYMVCHDAGSDERMLFVAAYNDTVLSITPTATISYNGNKPAGTAFSVTLAKYQSIQFKSTACTGTHVTSSKPISAYSGNRKTSVKYGGSADHLVEQMIPVGVWGKEYIVTPLVHGTGTREASGAMAIYYIVAAKDNTAVTLKTYVESTGAQVGSDATVTINKGKSHSFEPDKDNIVVVTSDIGILLVQISTTKQSGCKGDPWSQVMPPTYQFERDYSLLTPSLENNGGSCPAKHYITIIVPDAEKGGIILEGDCSSKTLSSSSYKSVPGTEFVEQTLEIDDSSTCRVRHSKTNVVFGVYFYGYGYADSYATTGGLRMSPIFETCVATESLSLGDGIDNDCNGKIDDEVCTAFDKNKDCAPPAPIKGGWSSYTTGSSCVCPPGSSAGASGIKTETRICNDPTPKHNGAPCDGSSSLTESCTCVPIHGAYSAWSSWSDCTATCGGTKNRERFCNSPTPDYGGNDCTSIGGANETINCAPCIPIHGDYSAWSSWSDCTATCGGTKNRERFCNSPTPDNGGNDCTSIGGANETINCAPCTTTTETPPLGINGVDAQEQNDKIDSAKAEELNGGGLPIPAMVAGIVGGLAVAAGCIFIAARRFKKKKKEEEKPKPKSKPAEDMNIEEFDVM